MKNQWLVISLLLVFCGVSSCSLIAQDQGSARGNLSGLVYDSTKAVVPGAQVTITGPIGSQTQTTSEEVSFLFSTLIPGNYSVKVQKTGFKVASIKIGVAVSLMWLKSSDCDCAVVCAMSAPVSK